MTRLGEGLLEVQRPAGQGAVRLRRATRWPACPTRTRSARGLAREDLFTVVVEHFPTDTVDYADIVLPGDDADRARRPARSPTGTCTSPGTSRRSPPPGECLPHTEMFRRLARRMGLDEPSLYDSDEELARQVLRLRRPGAARASRWRRSRREGWLRLNYPQPFVPFADGFPTPSGKLEFYRRADAELGLDPLAGYTPPYEAAQRGTAAGAPLPARADRRRPTTTS